MGESRRRHAHHGPRRRLRRAFSGVTTENKIMGEEAAKQWRTDRLSGRLDHNELNAILVAESEPDPRSKAEKRIDDLLGQREEARATIEKLRTGLTTLVERLRWCDPYLEGDAQDLLDIIPPEVK